MNRRSPIYTEKTECQDCFKCVRHCTVKAIKIEQGSAQVVPELCVACGHCVSICPAGAKQIRDDREAFRRLVASGRPVYVSLAPSCLAEFSDWEMSSLIRALRGLGVTAVSETALGAQAVAKDCRRLLQEKGPGLYLSTACPAAVAFVQRYMPELSGRLMEVSSPMIRHAQMLHRLGGADAAVVFAGPCAAKKLESDRFPGLVDVVLTFRDLRALMEEAGLDAARKEGDAAADVFMPVEAGFSVNYPVAGGMIETMLKQGEPPDADLITVAGLDSIRRYLTDLPMEGWERPVMLELLACEGGVHQRAGDDGAGAAVDARAARSAPGARAHGVGGIAGDAYGGMCAGFLRGAGEAAQCRGNPADASEHRKSYGAG